MLKTAFVLLTCLHGSGVPSAQVVAQVGVEASPQVPKTDANLIIALFFYSLCYRSANWWLITIATAYSKAQFSRSEFERWQGSLSNSVNLCTEKGKERS